MNIRTKAALFAGFLCSGSWTTPAWTSPIAQFSFPVLKAGTKDRPERLVDIAENLSGAQVVAGHLFAVADEYGALVRAQGGGATSRLWTLGELLADCQDLGRVETVEEIDLEGLAWMPAGPGLAGSTAVEGSPSPTPPRLLAVASTSFRRFKPKKKKALARRGQTNAQRLGIVRPASSNDPETGEPERYGVWWRPGRPWLTSDLLFPLELTPQGVRLDCQRVVHLLPLFESLPELRAFLPHRPPAAKDALASELAPPRVPSKDNGLDVEAVAVDGQRVLLGLRGPVLRGHAVVVAADWTAAGLANPEAFFLDLEGRGIRGMEAFAGGPDRAEGIYLIAGPTMEDDPGYHLYRWSGTRSVFSNEKKKDRRGALEKVARLKPPKGEDEAKPESIFTCGEDLCLLYDGPDGGALAEAPED